MGAIRGVVHRLDALTMPSDTADSVVAPSGVSLHLSEMYGLFWLVCLGDAVLLDLSTQLPGARMLLVAACAALFVGLYAWLIGLPPATRLERTRAVSRRTLLPFVLLAVLVLLLSFADGPAWLWLFVGVSALAGLVLLLPLAVIVVTGFTLLSLVLEALRQITVQTVSPALLLRGLGFSIFGLWMLACALRQVQTQRQALAQLAVTHAQLAVAEERLRVARDLHDLLGHTLSTITLKSALAQRLAASDSTRAADEMGEVERVARATLREVRTTIAGYRQPALRDELEAARQILEAASIEATIDDATGPVPTAIDGTLAWVVREGVTNILRHSHATACHITLARQDGAVRLAIVNDGCQRASGAAQAGSGVAGLCERVKALGGQLSAGPAPFDERPGFQLQVELPLRAAPGEREAQL